MNRTAAIGGTMVAICVVLAAVGWRERSHLELWLALQGAGSNPRHPLIAMLGDSHVDAVNWRLLLHCDRIGNYGERGNTTAQMLARLPRILDLKPKLLMVMGGTNDALLDIAPQETIANLKAIEAEATRNGTAFISFSPPPLPAKADVLAPIRATASLSIPFDEGDLAKDHVHLRSSGYAKWRDAAMSTVMKYCVQFANARATAAQYALVRLCRSAMTGERRASGRARVLRGNTAAQLAILFWKPLTAKT